MYKLAIFDMDGTIANSLNDIMVAGNFALETLHLKAYSFDEYKEFIGDGTDVLLQKMLKAQNAFTTKNMEILKENYFSYYSEHPYDLVNAYSGLETALTNLKNKGIALAVATNKPQNLAEVITERLYGGSLFTYVFGATPNRILKPDPQIVEEILAVSGFKKEETVMVGDLDVDILTGINAGISTICVKWGYATPEREINLKKLKIDYIVNTPEELQEIF